MAHSRRCRIPGLVLNLRLRRVGVIGASPPVCIELATKKRRKKSRTNTIVFRTPELCIPDTNFIFFTRPYPAARFGSQLSRGLAIYGQSRSATQSSSSLAHPRGSVTATLSPRPSIRARRFRCGAPARALSPRGDLSILFNMRTASRGGQHHSQSRSPVGRAVRAFCACSHIPAVGSARSRHRCDERKSLHL